MSTVTASQYKDIFAVRVETEKLIALFLPYNGGKLVSLTDKADGRELLCVAEGESYKPITLESSFVDGECSAFDDMFPTIDPYAPDSGSRKGVSYVDHGEVCRSRFDFLIDNGALRMQFISGRLGYIYTKTAYGAEDGSLIVDYSIENTADDAFPFLWAGHCMLAASDGGRVITPYSENAEAEIMFDDFGTYGLRGDRVPVTNAMLTSKKYNAAGDAYKYYFTAPVPQGWLRYTNPASGRDFVLEYDPIKIPYIGVWMNDGHFKGMYNVAPEIASVAYDTPGEALKRGQSSIIEPHCKFEFSLKIHTEETAK